MLCQLQHESENRVEVSFMDAPTVDGDDIDGAMMMADLQFAKVGSMIFEWETSQEMLCRPTIAWHPATLTQSQINGIYIWRVSGMRTLCDSSTAPVSHIKMCNRNTARNKTLCVISMLRNIFVYCYYHSYGADGLSADLFVALRIFIWVVQFNRVDLTNWLTSDQPLDCTPGLAWPDGEVGKYKLVVRVMGEMDGKFPRKWYEKPCNTASPTLWQAIVEYWMDSFVVTAFMRINYSILHRSKWSILLIPLDKFIQS